MKKTINEIAKFQRLAGLITESEYQETMMKDEEKVEEVKDMPYHEIAAKVIANALENGNTDQSKLDILVTIKDAVQKKIENMHTPGGSKKEVANIKEVSSEAFERMNNLVNRNHVLSLLAAAEGIMGDLSAEGFEVEDIRDYINQIIVNDI